MNTAATIRRDPSSGRYLILIPAAAASMSTICAIPYTVPTLRAALAEVDRAGIDSRIELEPTL